MNPAQDNQRTDLEAPGEAVDFGIQFGALPVFLPEDSERHQQFGCDPVAPALNLCSGIDAAWLGDRSLTQPDMGQFMGQGKHLGRLGIRAVDEHQRRQVIRHGKAAKLIRIELPVVVVQHHAAAHDEYAQRIRLLDEPAQRIGPGRILPALLDVKSERVPNTRRRRLNPSVMRAEPTNGSGSSPMDRAKSRYHSWRCWQM